MYTTIYIYTCTCARHYVLLYASVKRTACLYRQFHWMQYLSLHTEDFIIFHYNTRKTFEAFTSLGHPKLKEGKPMLSYVVTRL